MPSFFITGTDTGVGKTWFTSWLLRAWLGLGYRAAGLKPISTGERDDALLLQAAAQNALTLDDINPLHFREPAAPLLATEAENRSINFAPLNQQIAATGARFSHFAVEGVGGWRVPLARDYDVREWARDLGYPVIVVARASLGTLNHTLLTADSIRAAGLTCAGIIVNPGPDLPDFDLARRRSAALLRDLLGLPVLEFDRGVQAAGHVPLWLGGEKI
jgi:dethiobiotin synthetase